MTFRPVSPSRQNLLSLRPSYPSYPSEQSTVTITRRVVTIVQVPYIEAEITSANLVLTRLLALREPAETTTSDSITTRARRNINYA